MRRPTHVLRHCFTALLVLSGALLTERTWAQDAPLSARPFPELASARLRYGAVLRQGGQLDLGPGLTYDGLTPNDMTLFATLFGGSWFGGWLTVQREAFSLFDGDTRVTGGGLLRASAGPAARASLGPVRGELSVGYGFAQLPVFGSSGAPVFDTGTRHAALVGGRLVFPLFLGVRAEARGELPLTLSAKDSTGAATSASGFAAGAAVLIPLHRPGAWVTSALVDYQYVDDTLSREGLTSEQQMHRLGAGLELAYRGAEAGIELPTLGDLTLRVVDAQTQAPLPEAQVTLTLRGEALPARPVDAAGRLSSDALEPGEVVIRAEAGGYLPVEARARIVAGRRTTLDVAARKEPPKVGALRVAVTSTLDNAPLPGVTVSFGGTDRVTDKSGQLLVKGVPAGLVEVKLSAPEYKPAEEAVEIVASRQTDLAVKLSPVKRREPATVSGLIRSVRGGRPVAATLEIPEANIDITANARGAFSVEVQGGTYQVIISAKGYRTQTKSFTVRDGDQAIFNVDLFPSSR